MIRIRARPVSVAVGVMTVWLAGCGSSSPAATAPSGKGLAVVCPSPLLAGQTVSCHATSAATAILGATWSTSDPTIASVVTFGGLLTGHGDGQVTVTATYAGQSGSSAPVSVQLVDVVEVVVSGGDEGVVVGRTMLMQLGGYYGVASADSGQLSFVITDQNNAVISTSTTAVTRGGDRFVMQNIFTVSPGTTQICRKMVLQIGSATLTAIPSAGLRPCFSAGP
jgi:hypothetical protein